MKVTVLLLLTCELCWTIRVPVSWDEGESDVTNESDEEFSVESFKPQNTQLKSDGDSREALRPQNSGEAFKPRNEQPVPVEYFEYTAKKPQFAVDVAAFHGVQSPENHYKAYPIRPHTGRLKPELGKHHILDNRNTLHKPFQDYTKINENADTNPVLSSYEVFHPYKAETPALQEIYRDPVMTKIRNDLENSKSRLQQYEKDTGEPDITKDEYLESPQKTDSKLFPHRNRPAPYEIHRPQRRPVYYRPSPVYKSREEYLNHKLRSPWNHNIAKVRPAHYRPIQNHIHKLRQHHALKYDDERNEYPQVQIYENYSDPKDGHDIYERGKDKFVQLRNNVDESINNAVKENRPATYEKLEVQNDSASGEDGDNEEEFIPIKNYAQVRRTESFRHLPRSAALEDAETFDEIKNAPRLREAVKSTKAQTVYSEEGYEDAAYDHAGEQKHASENEGHGGFLKEHELSGGKYKAPSLSANYEDGKGSVYRDQNIHAEKWKDDNKDTKEEENEENYTEDEHEQLLEADNYENEPQDEENHRNKRENSLKNETLLTSVVHLNNTEDNKHEVDKREVNFKVPHVDLNSTFFKDSEFLKIAKLKVVPKKDTIKQKYPYYFKNLKAISKNSPLRYAENLKLIPKKSKGGTEFYDSRSRFECPEVDDVPDPIPEKLKGDRHPDDGDERSEKAVSTKGDENFDTTKKQPRLKGLGDKIDCFKAKYFGENPLDSPFFKEDIISNPEPVFLPNIAAYKLKTPVVSKIQGEKAAESKTHSAFENFHENNTTRLFDLIDKLRNEQDLFQRPVLKPDNQSSSPLEAPSTQSNINNSKLADQSSVYDDVIKNIKTSLQNITSNTSFIDNIYEAPNTSNQNEAVNNITYTHFQSKEDITKSPLSRKKRAAPFVYEPYKIIRDSQIQDDLKKTNAISNVSPLIRQLQSSRAIETGNKLSSKDTQHAKRNVNARAYTDIGQKDREIKYGSSKNDKSYEDSEIVDVSIDKRRGEPKYEIKHENHKTRYTPVRNTKSMTKRDYEIQISHDDESTTKTRGESSTLKAVRQRKPTEKPYFDVSKFIPRVNKVQSTTSTYTVRETAPKETTTLRPQDVYIDKSDKQDTDSESDEDYEDYDDDEKDDEQIVTSSTTTTTSKPVLKRKIRPQTTTQEPREFIEEPRLRLVTRFRDYKPKDHQEDEQTLKRIEEYHKKPIEKIIQRENTQFDKTIPQFREKKKKLTKSTLVTDSKTYGDVVDDDEKMMKDEVDALIGVKHDIDEYVPLYEKEEENKSKGVTSNVRTNKESKEEVDNDDDIDEDEEDNNEDDNNEEEEDEEDDDFDDDDDEDDESVESDNDDVSTIDEENIKIEGERYATTPEPTKRTLVITTDAPVPTTASRSAKLQARPIVTRKKIEIHEELPVNKSSPHITQFKQDIKEIEIIKETRNPLRRKPNKNVEVLDLYKDDNLAKDVNKLGVEIFKENLDLRQGPKHGGNYKSVESSTTVRTHEKSRHSKEDAETSQSEYNKNVELDDTSNRNSQKSQKLRSRYRNSKLIELTDSPDTNMHGGNLKQQRRSRNNNDKSQKLELVDEQNEAPPDDSLEVKSYSSSRKRRPMHGGNYRSAQLTNEKAIATESAEVRSKDTIRNAALVLNSFVQAAPVLTTKPAFILDPSQRKYYYVDA